MKYKLIALLIFILLVIVSFNGVMGEDEGRFSYIGRVWTDNSIPPYSGTVENKAPGIIELFAISNIIFGINLFFVRALGIISIAFASIGIYHIGKKWHSDSAGLLAMIIFGFTVTWRLLDGAFNSMTEDFMILFVVLSLLTGIQIKDSNNRLKWILLSGISMGFAIAFKQIAITSGLGILIILLLILSDMTTVKYLIYSVLVYGFGILIGTFISLIPIFLSGVSFMEYFNGVWLILLKHGPGPSLLHRIQFFRQLWLESRFVYFYPFLLLLVLQGNLLKNKYILGLLIWLFLDFVGVNASGYYFGHQLKQIMPSLSLIIGILIANSLYKHIVKKDIFKKHINRIAVVVIFFLLPYDLLIDNYLRIRQDNYIHSDKEVGLFIKNNTNPEDYLFFLCNANAVLAYSDRVTSSKHFCPLFINYPDEYNEVYSDLLNKPPKLIIRRELDIWHFPAKFEDYVEQNYSLFHKQYDFLIYKRNL